MQGEYIEGSSSDRKVHEGCSRGHDRKWAERSVRGRKRAERSDRGCRRMRGCCRSRPDRRRSVRGTQ